VPTRLVRNQRYKDASVFISPSFVLEMRPEFALAMSAIVFFWAEAEVEIGNFLIQILGAESRREIEKFIERANSTKRQEMILTHASGLADDLFEALSVLLKMVSSTAKERNKIAHWVSGVILEMTDGIILINTSNILRSHVQTREDRERVTHFNAPQLSFLRDKMYIYNMRDLQKVRAEIDEIKKGFGRLGGLVNAPTPQWRGVMFGKLSTLPRFREGLEDLRAGRSKPLTRIRPVG
jgi:hypothetical protein